MPFLSDLLTTGRKTLGDLFSPSDLMSPQAQTAYKDATGGAIGGPETAPQAVERTSQGVTAGPAPNVAGLARLLMQTGRAVDMQSALRMAAEMTRQ